MENFKKRKPLRLKEFDYSSPNGYFITICVDKRKKVLSSVVGQGLAPAEIKLSEFGNNGSLGDLLFLLVAIWRLC